MRISRTFWPARRNFIGDGAREICWRLQIPTKHLQIGCTRIPGLYGWAYMSNSIAVGYRLGRLAVYKSLAHELRHVWQWRNGLLQLRRGVWYWDGRPEITHRALVFASASGSPRYYYLPWEIDAREFEDAHLLE
jgi:hypothetical protein